MLDECGQPHPFRGGPFRRDNTERHHALLRLVRRHKLECSLYEHRLPGLRNYLEETRSVAKWDGQLHLPEGAP